MLYNHSMLSRLLSSRTLTVAIVSTVVLINSVAWGIPLLVTASQQRTVLDGSKTNAASPPTLPEPRVERRGNRMATVAPPKARKRIPLPVQAPGSEHLRALLQSREPATMFPRPVAAPAATKTLSASAVRNRVGARDLGGPQRERYAARDIVLVSPYTPGVRIAPDGRGHEWRHRNLRSSSGPTTIDRARAIARRAAQRFEQMRDRMAKHNARGSAPTVEDRAHGLALLPVAPRPPRIVTGSVGRSATKSSRSYIRARLVRRPITSISLQPPRNFSPAFVMSVAPAQAAAPPSEETRSGVEQRVAHLTPPSTVRVERTRARPRKVRRRRGTARAREKWRRARRHRATRSRHTRRTRQRSRGPRRINGFRRGFHRQLVAANFFGTNN